MLEVVVFDLDGTLLSDDSTKCWLIKQLKSNLLRLIVAILILPIAMFLMRFKRLKLLGTSLFLWVATYGLNQIQLVENLNRFAEKVASRSIPNLYWFEDGLSVLKKHLHEGREIVIATASPEPLAKALLKSIGLDVKIVGTPLKTKFNGWIGGVHCRHQEKLRRLLLIGIKPQWYATYSDDIEEDAPILKGAKFAYLINDDQRERSNREVDQLHYLEWN